MVHVSSWMCPGGADDYSRHCGSLDNDLRCVELHDIAGICHHLRMMHMTRTFKRVDTSQLNGEP